MPPLELGSAETELRPTLFFGIGGLAVQTLQALHRRIEMQFGDPDALPALQFLVFETDAESLKTATDGETAPLKNNSAVLLPLRQSTDYRNDADGRFHWLSRRWIYNIPRNAQTQGLRPLGRLALVDNMERVIAAVTRVVRTAMDPAGIAATAAIIGRPFHPSVPRVFIVSSTTGGCGSGTVLDFGYIVRQVLRKQGLADDSVLGVLAHCTGRNPQTRDLSTANTYALLSELNHYADPHRPYPGDPAAGLNAFGVDDSPFSQTYFVHLGEELDANGLAAGIDTLASYLYHGALTRAAVFFDKCRGTCSRVADSGSQPSTDVIPALRTFGVCRMGFTPEDVPPDAADTLCRVLLSRWRGNEVRQFDSGEASLSDPTSLLATQFAEGISAEKLRAAVVARTDAAALALDRVVTGFHTQLSEQMGNDRQAYLLAALGKIVNHLNPQRTLLARIPPGKVIAEALDAVVFCQGVRESRRLCLESALETPICQTAVSAGNELRQWLLALVNDPEFADSRAQRMADCVAEHLRDLSRQAGERVLALSGQLQTLKELLGDTKRQQEMAAVPGLVFRADSWPIPV